MPNNSKLIPGNIPGLSWDNITEPDVRFFQVRVVRQKKEWSGSFSHRKWGGRDKSFEAANNWRDQIKCVLPGSKKRHMNPLSNKKSTGVLGVFRATSQDNRKNINYLSYSVFWVDNKNKRRMKSFRVGRTDEATTTTEFRAFRMAVLFRKTYEFMVDRNLEFDPDYFYDWRERYHLLLGKPLFN